MIDRDIIDEALNFYNIDLQYRDKCYNCAEEINTKEKLSLAFSNLYKKLYIEEFNDFVGDYVFSTVAKRT